VCIHNGDLITCPVRALCRCFIHIRQHTADTQAFLSSYYVQKRHLEVTDRNISVALKVAALILAYPSHGFPVDHIDPHSLRSGGANALSLAGYSDRQIQKMGCWKGVIFKKCIQKELHMFSKGISCNMKRLFKFANTSGGMFHDAANAMIAMDYNVNTALTA
jgi:hypothetical protein